MSTCMNNLFNFARSLPSPFDTLTNKKVKVSSKYGKGTESTLCATVIKAVNAVCAMQNGSGLGAVGTIDDRSVAEYKSSMGPDSYHLVVYDYTTGSIMASIYDASTEVIESYTLLPTKMDGAAVFLALMPFLMKDDEFKEKYEDYYDEYIKGFPDFKKATESMAYLCDNA